jgi:putative flippase GtrA
MNSLWRTAKRARPSREFSLFLLVGVCAFGTDAIIFQSLISFAKFDPYLARIISAIAAIWVSWVLNKSYTFKMVKTDKVLNKILAHVTATTFSFAINLLIFMSVLSLVGIARTYPIIALCVASGFGMFINFLLAKFWVFNDR